jgi:hypothetical protein
MAYRVDYATTCRRYRRILSLVPPPSAVPTAGDNQQYDDDDQKGCVVHIVLVRGSMANDCLGIGPAAILNAR